METGAGDVLEAALGWKGPFRSALARALRPALALLCLAFIWESPHTRRLPTLLLAVSYAAVSLAAPAWLAGGRRERLARPLGHAAEAAAVGLGAHLSGGLESSVWLLLYPHVVALSARGGLPYALAFGALDAGILCLLAVQGGAPLGLLHALTLLFCAATAGSASSRLQAIRRDQEHALLRLRASQERYRGLLERIQDGVLIIQDGRVIYANPAFARLAGRTAEELRGTEFAALAPEEDRPRLVARYRTWQEGGSESGVLECRVRAPEGQTRLVSVRAGAVEFEGKRGLIATVRDTTRERQMEGDLKAQLEAVRRRGREFESLLETGRGVVERLELKELLPLVTRSVNRVMGTSHCLLLLRAGDDLEVAAQEGLEPEVVAAFRGLKVGDSLSGWVIAQGQPLAVTHLLEDPRLRFGPLVQLYNYRSYLGVPLRRGAEILGTLEVVTKHERVFGPDEQALMSAFADQAAVALENARLFEEGRAHLARVVEANRRLEELDRLRQQYLRNISHEFRTPLTVIKGYTEFLLAAPPSAAPLPEVLGVMRESCDRLIDMVDTLIDVSRVEQERAGALEVQPLELRELTARSVEAPRLAAQKKQVSLELDFPPSALPLEGDGGLLRQVVRKLVDNAVKYSPPGARVVVRGRLEGEELALEVEDAGLGIPPEHLSRIFEKFYTVDGGLARNAGGSGVGLYLVREIVRLHHGSVAVRSLPGRGSVFSVRLPRRFPGPPRRAALA